MGMPSVFQVKEMFLGSLRGPLQVVNFLKISIEYFLDTVVTLFLSIKPKL